ncbi:hypothetical protein EIP86_003590 [Pleurotus ostreatoroseus]|nr:hypothetical protein EIP86_003590 [Pleurotus ostreatoroseus]
MWLTSLGSSDLSQSSANISTTVWSPLASGLLTGKYNDGIPANSRFSLHYDTFKNAIDGLTTEQGAKKLDKIRALAQFAEFGTFFSSGAHRCRTCNLHRAEGADAHPLYFEELGCSLTHLALAWVANFPTTSSVILGASKPEQVLDNLRALEVLPKLTPDVLQRIEAILQNQLDPTATFGRPPLDGIRG